MLGLGRGHMMCGDMFPKIVVFLKLLSNSYFQC